MAKPAHGDTADAIREAAAELFYERGYEATSMRDIAAKVGVRVGSLYNHLDGKYELLSTIMYETMNKLDAMMSDALSGLTDPVERFEAALDCHIRFHAINSRSVFISNSELRSLSPKDRTQVIAQRREYEEGTLTAIVQDAAAAYAGTVVNARLLAYALAALGTRLAAWNRESETMTLDEIVAGYTEAFSQLVGGDVARTASRQEIPPAVY